MAKKPDPDDLYNLFKQGMKLFGKTAKKAPKKGAPKAPYKGPGLQEIMKAEMAKINKAAPKAPAKSTASSRAAMKKKNQPKMVVRDSSGRRVPLDDKGRPIPQREQRPNISGERRSLPKGSAEQKEAGRQAGGIIRRADGPQAPRTRRPDAQGRYGSDFEADELRRQAAADRRSMSSQPARGGRRAEKSAANRQSRHDAYMKKLDDDIKKAKHPKTREAAKQRKADYLKKRAESDKAIKKRTQERFDAKKAARDKKLAERKAQRRKDKGIS